MRQRVLAMLLLTAAAAAQSDDEVALTGVVQPQTLATICQEETHVLECSGVFLKSSVVNLDLFVGQAVKLFAVLRGVECDIYDVQSIEFPPPSRLTFCGNPVPGCEVRLRSGPGGNSQHLLFVSLTPAFLPLNPIKGTFFLGEPNLLLATADGAFPAPGAAFDLGLPPDVSLSGLTVYMQSARRDVGLDPVAPGPFQFSNLICFTILGPSPPCVQPGC